MENITTHPHGMHFLDEDQIIESPLEFALFKMFSFVPHLFFHRLTEKHAAIGFGGARRLILDSHRV